MLVYKTELDNFIDKLDKNNCHLLIKDNKIVGIFNDVTIRNDCVILLQDHYLDKITYQGLDTNLDN